jgi:acyl-CoA reductase-like NAD-dependent aldehyde dehydrogenase
MWEEYMIDLNRVTQSIPPVLTGLLNGNPVDDEGGERIAVVNPDDGSLVLELIESNVEQVNQSVVAARISFDGGSWSKASISYRQKVLFKAAELIRRDAEVLAAQDSLCTGLLYHKSTLGQTRYAAADWFEYFASLIGSFGEELFRHVAGAKTLVTREPAGVAGLFTPWNIPLMGASLKLAAALAMGNSCVLKPSEQSPLSTYRLVQLLYRSS